MKLFFTILLMFSFCGPGISGNADIRELKQSGEIADFIVDQNGQGDFSTIMDAINATQAFPDQRITIYVKNGTYTEKVRIYSWNTLLTLRGESLESTIISFGDYFDSIGLGRNSTFHTYTMKVEANDFIVENITIENTAGPVGQAVALHVEGDRCLFVNCRVKGFQDTLYVAGEGSRQLFANCFIEGSTDFIFGEGTTIFNECTINSKSNSFITAASTPKSEAFGFVFINCELTADQGITSVYLGRPWRDFAKTVFLNCILANHIRPEGWSNWDGTDRDTTAFYGEYRNCGEGASVDGRIEWSHQLTEAEAAEYNMENIFRGWQQANTLPALQMY